MKTIKLKIAANSSEAVGLVGDYIRIRLAPYDVIIEHAETGEAFEGSQGDDFELAPFKELIITNTGAVDSYFKFTIATGKKAGSSQIAGSVTLTNPVNGAFVQGRASVTNVNQVLLAANALRRFLMIQNNDVSAVLRVVLAATAATAAQGFRVQPGAVLEVPNFAVNTAINVMMETATAAVGNVEFVEG